MGKNIFYTEVKKLNEINMPYAFYEYYIDWNVPQITEGKEINGYIVQKVHFEPGLECIGGCDDYYEAWMVVNNAIVNKKDVPDDKFSSGNKDVLNILLEGSIGKKAKTIYQTEVYWINKSDPEYNSIDLWESGAVILAGELKSVYVKEVSNFKPSCLICNRFFEHITDCTSLENVKKSIIHCYFTRLNKKDQEMKQILYDLLVDTEFEILIKDILGLYEIY